jgi:hypothetical protein
MFLVQNEKGYNVFCFFPFKKLAFRSVPVFPACEGGTKIEIEGDECINIAPSMLKCYLNKIIKKIWGDILST